ncbi:MAG: hypothetical protein JWP44_471 [Mucilaginibacter sp.]|nr:hypothetical protein [Mucilaginibacter sp.]
MRAKGEHYDPYKKLPVIVGVDGVGVLLDGTRVYTGSKYGMMAEKAAISSRMMVPLPDGIDDVTAAAIANPAVSAWLSLEWKGRLQKGDCVLILGATGVTGKLAIQIAKHLGAGKIVALGRNPEALNTLKDLGADVVISLNHPDEDIKHSIAEEAKRQPFDLVLDYLWGKPAELLLEALKGHDLHAESHFTRYLQIGEMAGASINLDASILRSSSIEISGVGGGSVPMEVLAKIPTEYLPKVFNLAAERKLLIDTETMKLNEIEAAWQRTDLPGKRLVIIP